MAEGPPLGGLRRLAAPPMSLIKPLLHRFALVKFTYLCYNIVDFKLHSVLERVAFSEESDFVEVSLLRL